MKKKKINFFLLSAVLTLLVACSSSDEAGMGPETSPSSSKTYPVKFTVAPFDMVNNPFQRGWVGEFKHVVQWGIYDANPSTWDNPPILDDINVSDSKDLSSITINEELPVGSYIVFVMYSFRDKYDFYLPWFNEDPSITDDERDGYGIDLEKGLNETWVSGDWANAKLLSDVYFKRISFDITEADGGVSKELKLNPKWSTITLNIEDAGSIQVPEGTTHISMLTVPTGYGFSIKDEEPAVVSLKNEPAELTLEEFRSMQKLSTTTGAVPATKIYLQFSKKDGVNTISNLGTLLLYSGEIEEGKKITFKGNLGNQSGSETIATGLKLTIKDFIDKDIEIEEPIRD